LDDLEAENLPVEIGVLIHTQRRVGTGIAH
jgi:hypothetical protein